VIPVSLVYIIFFVHEALLIADLESYDWWTFWTWNLYIYTAAFGFSLPMCVAEGIAGNDPCGALTALYGLIWVALHGIGTAAAAIGHFVYDVNISNLVPSMMLGKALAKAIQLPPKELSIYGTTFILILVSILLPTISCLKIMRQKSL